MVADGLEVLAYSTNVSILGPEGPAYEARASVEREAAFHEAYLTWNEEAQTLEDELLAAGSRANGDPERLRRRLDRIQVRIDRRA